MGKKLLVVVDVQNDFVKGGVLAYGYPEESNTEAICDLVKEFLNNGDYVIATRDTHYANYLDTLEGKMLHVKHCIHNTHGWQLVDGLNRLVDEGMIRVVDKETFGTFEIRNLVNQICVCNGCEIDEIHMAGFCTSICTLSNAVILRAKYPDMRIVLHKDLCGDINKESHEAALKVLRNQLIEIV